ncbi:MAG TPA: hypothetical protein VFK70_09245 [Vicinamibacteria bacterium]|nr:hypothetical protein [Vicinamibacteria bacterium]
MSDDVVADVLGQVVGLGPNPREAELGAAVSRHVSSRPATAAACPDTETVAALRALAAEPDRVLSAEAELGTVPLSPLAVSVDFNDLLADVGEPAVWRILGHLKDLFP